MSHENEVRLIRAEPGKDGKDPVGSFAKGHLVFLPRGCEPDREYRMVLHGVVDAGGNPKCDRRGKQLYRGTPAPDVMSEGWRDNNDGTLSRCRVTTNWKLEESIQVLETRPKARTDGSPFVRSTFTRDFSTGLSAARIEITMKTEIPEVEERLPGNGYDRWPTYLTTREVARRDGGTKVETFAVEALEVESSYHSDDFLRDRLQAVYSADMYVGLVLRFGGDRRTERQSHRFADLPRWVRDHLAAPYPLCACGRERVDTTAGHATCGKCQAEAAEQATIAELLPAEKREEFARIAALCDAAAVEGRAWEGEAGAELVIAVSESHYGTHGWRGYPWYYSTDEGFFASRFPPEAMMILAGLPNAAGRGLVTLAAWLTDDHKVDQCAHDFYARTQVQGEEVEPRIDRWSLERSLVAVFLRESEAMRQAKAQAAEEARLTAQTTFVEKAPRQFLCGSCGCIETMGKTAWNRLKNTGATRNVCSCGAWGDVSRDQATAPAPKPGPAPAPAKSTSLGSSVDLSKLPEWMRPKKR